MKKILWLIVLIPLLSLAQGKPIIDGIKLIPQGAPGSPIEGELYYDDTSNTIFVWNGSAWLDLSAGGGGSQDLQSVITQGNQSFGNILPGTDANYNLGAFGETWDNIYTNQIYVNTLSALTSGGVNRSVAVDYGLAFTPRSKASMGGLTDGVIVNDTDENSLFFYDGSAWQNLLGGSLDNIVEDTTPQLGGTLDAQSNNITGVNILLGNSATITTVNASAVSIDSGSNSFLNIANSATTGYAPGLGDGAIYFVDDAMRIATTDASTENPDLEINTGALTVARDLTFTDTDVTYNGTSLTSGGSGLTATQTDQLEGLYGSWYEVMISDEDGTQDPFLDLNGERRQRVGYVQASQALTVTLDNTHELGRKYMYFVSSATSSITFQASSGVSIIFEGQGDSQTGDQILVDALGSHVYFTRIANNQYVLAAEGTISSVVSNLYTEQSNANASNTGGTGSFVSDQGGGFAAVTEDSFPAIAITPDQSEANDAAGLPLEGAAVSTWSGGQITSFTANATYDVVFDYKHVDGTFVSVWTGSALLPLGNMNAAASFTEYTFSFTVPSGGFTSGATLAWRADDPQGVATLYIKNLRITQQ